MCRQLPATEVIYLAVSRPEKQVAQEMARARGESLRGFVRTLIRDAAEKQHTPIDNQATNIEGEGPHYAA